MTGTTPFFSIVIPVFNCKRFILNAIKSVEHQTFESWELIIVDDSSTDGTYELVKNYIYERDKMKLLRTSFNFGSPGKPRDYGVKVTRGKYIGFLDADDMYHPDKLQYHFNSILSNPLIEFIHTSYNIIDEKKKFIKHQKQQWFLKLYIKLFKMKTVCVLTNPFGMSTVIIKKELIEKHPFGTFQGLLTAIEDKYNWCRIMTDSVPLIYYEKIPLTDYRWVKGSISNREAHRGELQTIIALSILLYERKINPIQWYFGCLIRFIRIFFKKFFGYS